MVILLKKLEVISDIFICTQKVSMYFDLYFSVNSITTVFVVVMHLDLDRQR